MSFTQKMWLTPFLNQYHLPLGDYSGCHELKAAGFLWIFSDMVPHVNLLRCELMFPRVIQLLAFNKKMLTIVFCVAFYFFKCLPSPVGMIGLSASEPPQSACPTADSKASFVTTHSSKAPKDCPVGFADFGAVSVVCLRFSVGSRISVCMSCWSHDLTDSSDRQAEVSEALARRLQPALTGPPCLLAVH